MRPCLALPAPVSAAVGLVGLCGCLVVLGIFAASRSVRSDRSAHLCASHALASVLCLVAWFIPAPTDDAQRAGASCALKRFLDRFGALAALLWANAFFLNFHLAVCHGHRLLWRYSFLYHTLCWLLPLVCALGVLYSEEAVGDCSAPTTHPAIQAILYDVPFAIGHIVPPLLLIQSIRAVSTRQPHRAASLRAAVGANMALLGTSTCLFTLFSVPHLILTLIHALGPPLPSALPSALPPAAAAASCARRAPARVVDVLRMGAEVGGLGSTLLPLALFCTLGAVVKQLRVLLRSAGGVGALGCSAALGFSAALGLRKAPGARIPFEGEHGAACCAGVASGAQPLLSTSDVSSNVNDAPAPIEAAGSAAGAAAAAEAATVETLAQRELRVWAASWNMGLESAADADALVGCLPRGGPESAETTYDLVAIAVQECNEPARFLERVQTRLGACYAPLLSRGFVRQALFVAVRVELLGCVRGLRAASHGTGLLRLLGNKGAVAVSFWIGEASLCFVGCHLAAHTQERARRDADLAQLLSGGLNLACGVGELPAEVHHLFLMGDMNYRLDRSAAAELGAADLSVAAPSRFRQRIVEQIERCEWSALLRSDQLTASRARGVLHGFVEGTIEFAPTYKFEVRRAITREIGREIERDQGPRYAPTHVPSYTDRILSHSTAGHAARLRQTAYGCCERVPRDSDHMPIYASWELSAPIAEQPERPMVTRALTLTLIELGVSVRAPLPPRGRLEILSRSPIYVTACDARSGRRTSRGIAPASDPPSWESNGSCSEVVLASPTRGTTHPTLEARWEPPQLPGVRMAGTSVAALRETALLLVVRDADLLEEAAQDVLGVGALPLLGLAVPGHPMPFRVPLTFGGCLCGQLEGRLVLSEALDDDRGAV